MSADILQALSSQPLGGAPRGGDEEALQTQPVSENEKRFKKKQVKIDMKRQQLAEELGPELQTKPQRPTVAQLATVETVDVREVAPPAASRFSVTTSAIGLRVREGGLGAALHGARTNKDAEKLSNVSFVDRPQQPQNQQQNQPRHQPSRPHSSGHQSHQHHPHGQQNQHRQPHHQRQPHHRAGDSRGAPATNDRSFDPAYRMKMQREHFNELVNESGATSSGPQPTQAAAQPKRLVIPIDGLSLRQVAQRMSAKLSDIRKALEDMGEWTSETMTEDTPLDADVLEIVALDMGYVVSRVEASEDEAAGLYDEAIRSRLSFHQRQAKQNARMEATGAVLSTRPPTVCIVGHVDHGKTTLLDALRQTAAPPKTPTKQKSKKDKGAAAPAVERLTDGEAGGITQRLSAFSVDVPDKGRVVFLDTPGHAAFASMRHKGAAATDIAVVVVAIDEGVMPQTEEAVRAVTAAGCAVVVALNKIDRLPASQRPAARAKILANLAQFDLLAEELGGDVQVVEVAAKSGDGVPALLEAIAVQSEVLDLKCVTDAPAEAMVLDAKLEKGRGIIADVIVRAGCLKVGDAIVVGNVAGRVKALYDDQNRPVQLATSSQPVRLLGLKELPLSGSELLVVESELRAKTIADRRAKIALLREQQAQQQLNRRNVVAASATGDAAATAADAPDAAATKQKSSLAVVLKADSLGALEALRRIVDEIARACPEDVTLRVASSGVGSVTSSDLDILTAALAGANAETMVLAFNVSVADNQTKTKAKQYDVEVVRDDVIYRLEDALKARIEDLLPAERVEKREGQAHVLKVFRIKDKKNTVVAGSSVTHGRFATFNHFVKEEQKLQAAGAAGGAAALRASVAARVNGFYRVTRGDAVIHEHPIKGIELKRFKDAASEVVAGLECGLSFDGYSDIQEGDLIECFKVSLKRRRLQLAPVFQYRPTAASS